MRKVLLGLALISAMLVGGEALACGDKFLVVGRGVRGQRIKGAVHHAAILLYVSPTGGVEAALRDTRLDRQLTLAGHKVRQVTERSRLEAVLASGTYDLVLAAIADMIALEPVVRAAPSRPTLLPVIYNPTGDELAAAQRDYACVMRSPSTQQGYLSVIEDALTRRQNRAVASPRAPGRD